MLLKEAALVKLLQPPALASLKFRVAFSQTRLRPSSEEHGHPLVDEIERNARALQRSDGWEAARGSAEGLLESPEGLQVFGQSLEQALELISACRVFRLQQGSLTAQVELAGQSLVLFSVCRFSQSIKKTFAKQPNPLAFSCFEIHDYLAREFGKRK